MLTACKKQIGCMDPLAANYDPSAEQDDGSCLPFQGPRNESFEYNGEWIFERAPNLTCMGGIVSSSGIGFMPTKGINFMFLEVGTGYKSGGGSLYSYTYQDNIDLSSSSKLIFDYQLYGTHVDGSVRVDIFFTSNGNQPIWSKQLFNTTQVMNEVVDLADFQDKGRLIIRLEKFAPFTYWEDGSHRFEIDNIRVE
jgi:hypothetical protein